MEFKWAKKMLKRELKDARKNLADWIKENSTFGLTRREGCIEYWKRTIEQLKSELAEIERIVKLNQPSVRGRG